MSIICVILPLNSKFDDDVAKINCIKKFHTVNIKVSFSLDDNTSGELPQEKNKGEGNV